MDFSSAGGLDESGDDKSMPGVQIVDPNNRYKHPKSKLNDSDMGLLTMALGQDSSIQLLPKIATRNYDSNEQAFYSSQAEL